MRAHLPAILGLAIVCAVAVVVAVRMSRNMKDSTMLRSSSMKDSSRMLLAQGILADSESPITGETSQQGAELSQFEDRPQQAL